MSVQSAHSNFHLPSLCHSHHLQWSITIIALGCLALGISAYCSYLPTISLYGSIGLLSAGGALASLVILHLIYNTFCKRNREQQSSAFDDTTSLVSDTNSNQI